MTYAELVDLIQNRIRTDSMNDPEDYEDDELEGDDDLDQIVEEGEGVFYHNWDSGGPGAGSEDVYHWNGKFVVSSDDFGNSGPYSSLDEAIGKHGLLVVTSATENIDCSLLTARELAKRLSCEEDGYEIELNGEPWVYRAKAGEFKRKRVRR
jgi:hypothetical protein